MVLPFRWSYLDKEDDKKIEIGNSSELFKEILGKKIPDCILQGRNKIGYILIPPKGRFYRTPLDLLNSRSFFLFSLF